MSIKGILFSLLCFLFQIYLFVTEFRLSFIPLFVLIVLCHIRIVYIRFPCAIGSSVCLLLCAWAAVVVPYYTIDRFSNAEVYYAILVSMPFFITYVQVVCICVIAEPQLYRVQFFFLKKKETLTCSICLEEIGWTAMCLDKCKHVFHKECIDTWLEYKKPHCPNCRIPLLL